MLTFTPEFGREWCLDNYLSTQEQAVKTMRGRYQRSNITQEEEEDIQSLRRNKNIVIFPADKGGGLVIQNRESYIKIVEEHLDLKDKDGNNVYQQLHSDITSDISKRVENAVDEALLLQVIDRDTADGLKVNSPKAGNLYCLPKIHKNPGSRSPPPRPICNSKQTPTERISEWVDDQLQPLVKELPSYIQDDNDFLRKIENINETHTLPPDNSCDVGRQKSLYQHTR